jgi:hypothetical protein
VHRPNILGYLQNVRLIGFFRFGQIVRFDLLQFSPVFRPVLLGTGVLRRVSFLRC